MANTALTKEELTHLARYLFIENYPGQEEWFDLAWEVLQEKLTEMPSPPSADYVLGLGISGTNDALAREMANELAMFFEACMPRFPIVKGELLERLELACKEHGKNETATRTLKQKIVNHLESPAEFVVLTSKPSQLGTSSQSATQETVEREFIAKMETYDVFVNRRAVYVRKGNEHVSLKLDERVYRLLVMLLRYKGSHLPIGQCWRKAWKGVAISEHYTMEDIVDLYLKNAISQLRAEMEGVKGFDIPDKLRHHGYMCHGKFSCCIILDEEMEKDSRLTIT